MKLEDSTAYTTRCFRGEPASCSNACPFHLDVRSFLERAGRGRWRAAYKVLRNATVFPGIVSVLCDQPCQGCCQRTVLGDEPLAIRDVEAACIRNTKEPGPESYVVPPKEGCIAIVGAGLAGLSTALNLAQKKYAVTVFEQQDGWGGSLRPHPRFAEFEADLALQFSGLEVEFRYGTRVGSLDELADFDAVYVATGAEGDSFGMLESERQDALNAPTSNVFLGGSLLGATLMEGIAHGTEAAKSIETFLQTGKAVRAYYQAATGGCGRYLSHDGAASAPRVRPSGPDGYTGAEAREEAGRCLQCDCDICIAACEMLKSFRKDPHRIGVDVYTDMVASPPLSVRTVTRETYSCNICGYCKSVCPVDVDMGALLQFSRSARQSAGISPAALHDFWLREMDFATSEGAFSSTPRGREKCEYAFYPGCQLGAANPEHVLRSYEVLRGLCDAGVFLGCCGAPAYWAGDDERLRTNIEQTRRQWNALGAPTLIFACATCASLFSSFMPEIPRVSLYQLLAVCENTVPPGPFARATVFDPCAARDDTGMQSGVRELVCKAGVILAELPERNRCCGHGGHIRVANPALYDEITRHRAEAGDEPYIVYCANCREVFASRGKECAHILDLVFGMDAGARVPSLHEKRENSLRVKRELMKQTEDTDFRPEPHEWDSLTLSIGDELQKEMDRKLISAFDVKEAIWLAETTGDKFYDESDGTTTCSMVKPVITYWVQYRQTAPDTFEVLSAYYHRMRIRQGE